MRITCPNCGAQYEVDDALIPDAGRDVQCSNCGKGWFQPKHAEPDVARSVAEDGETAAADAAPDIEAEAPAAARSEAPDEDAESAPAEAAAAPEPAPSPTPADARDEDDDAGEPPLAAAIPAPEPRRPDESVLSVLREEAEREMAQRRAEVATIESQPDLGLSEPPARRSGPSEGEIAAGAAVAASARRDLLPDIDEINSTLRPAPERGAADAAEGTASVAGERRRGFRTGFALMLLVAAALIGLYMAAGTLAAAVPALEPLLAGYVEAANALRAWIDGLLTRGVDAMSG